MSKGENIPMDEFLEEVGRKEYDPRLFDLLNELGKDMELSKLHKLVKLVHIVAKQREYIREVWVKDERGILFSSINKVYEDMLSKEF